MCLGRERASRVLPRALVLVYTCQDSNQHAMITNRATRAKSNIGDTMNLIQQISSHPGDPLFLFSWYRGSSSSNHSGKRVTKDTADIQQTTWVYFQPYIYSTHPLEQLWNSLVLAETLVHVLYSYPLYACYLYTSHTSFRMTYHLYLRSGSYWIVIQNMVVFRPRRYGLSLSWNTWGFASHQPESHSNPACRPFRFYIAYILYVAK
jgi:hypothetical protein